MTDGLLGKCKECARRDVAVRAALKRDELLEYDRKRAMLPHRVQARREYQLTERGKESHQRALRRQQDLHPDKYRAHVITRNAIRDGKLLRQPCSVCGSPKAQAHHTDYSKPLDVIWLCVPHHRAEHR